MRSSWVWFSGWVVLLVFSIRNFSVAAWNLNVSCFRAWKARKAVGSAVVSRNSLTGVTRSQKPESVRTSLTMRCPVAKLGLWRSDRQSLCVKYWYPVRLEADLNMVGKRLVRCWVLYQVRCFFIRVRLLHKVTAESKTKHESSICEWCNHHAGIL